MFPLHAQTRSFRAWILDVGRWGDTQQMRTLAEATPGLEYSILRLAPRKAFPKLRRVPRHSIDWLQAQSRALLSPPWPDVVFLAGRTAVSVALWIRRRHPETRLIAFGRPFAPFDLFDLVLSNTAYLPPKRPNILTLQAPLHVLDAERLQAEKRKWRERLRTLPRPHIALLVGGRSSPYRFAPDEAAHLGRETSRLAKRNGGSLLVATNNRVDPASARALFDAISVPSFLHDCHRDAENPYLAFLATADAFVVTMDSLSLMTEAASTGSRVMIFPLKEKRSILREWFERFYDASMHNPPLAPAHALLRSLETQGILLRRADRKGFAEWLIERGHAQWFAPDATVTPDERTSSRRLHMEGELKRAVNRLLAVLNA